MWIVKVALRRPYTFIMLAVLIVLMGSYAILRTPTDIFPNIKIPITAVIWRYSGILPEEIANRIVLFSERITQTTVNDVEHTESQSVNGIAVVKYFFQPDVDQELSFGQITAISQTQLFFSPPGTSPPFILSYSASSVPILQLALSSDSLSEAKIYDLGNTLLRTQLATVAGASIPFPYGGKQRQVQVDLDPQALRANALSPNDVVNAIGQQNLILPAGTEKIGPLEYFVKLNASPTQIEDLNDMPVRAQNGTVTYIRDVAHVRDGYSPQTNMVRVDGRRSVLMSVLKTGKASTIDIIDRLSVGARRDHQHHDLGGTRAGRGYPGGRCDRHHREHQLPPRARQGRRDGDPGRRTPDRPAGARVDAVHLHRLYPDVPSRGYRKVPVHSVGRSRGVRDAGLLSAVADPGSDARQVLAENARRRGAEEAGQRPRPTAGELSARLRAAS